MSDDGVLETCETKVRYCRRLKEEKNQHKQGREGVWGRVDVKDWWTEITRT